MNDNGPNHELFVQTLAQIERTPERWNQALFISQLDCGTAYCFAGWANLLSGARDELDIISDTRAGQRLGILQPEGLGDGNYETESGWYSDLFSAANTLADLYRISADILGLDEQVLRDKVADAVGDPTQGQSRSVVTPS